MKEKMFKWLFPSKVRHIEILLKKCEAYRKIRYDILKVPEGVDIVDFLQRKLDSPLSTRADLMRDSLGLPMFDLTNVDKEGYPPHYLDGLKPEERKVFLAELNSIYKKPQFHAVLDFWINTFGNHSIRKGKDEVEAGRYGINGVAMIRKSFEAAHQEITDSLKPPEDYDKHSVMPGE